MNVVGPTRDVRLAEGAPEPRGASFERDWHTATSAELVERIVVRYHRMHRVQLPEMIQLACRVERVHVADPACPAGLAAQLRDLACDLEVHMRREEELLFPLLARDPAERAVVAIGIARNEHAEHGDQLRRMVELTHDLTPPPQACASWRALYEALRAFRTDLLEHIHLENDILFARHGSADQRERPEDFNLKEMT